MPAPRRNCRRDNARWADTNEPGAERDGRAGFVFMGVCGLPGITPDCHREERSDVAIHLDSQLDCFVAALLAKTVRKGDSCSLVQEKLTLHDLVQQRAHTMTARGRAFEDFFDGGAVDEAHRGARRVNRQLPRQVARHLFLVGEE